MKWLISKGGEGELSLGGRGGDSVRGQGETQGAGGSPGGRGEPRGINPRVPPPLCIHPCFNTIFFKNLPGDIL